jgi:hypothetical protein
MHPRAGTALARAFRKCPRERRPSMSEIRRFVSDLVTNVKENVTVYRTWRCGTRLPSAATAGVATAAVRAAGAFAPPCRAASRAQHRPDPSLCAYPPHAEPHDARADNFVAQSIGADVHVINDGVDDRQVGGAGPAAGGEFGPGAAQSGSLADQLMHTARDRAAGQIAAGHKAGTDLDQIIVGPVGVCHGRAALLFPLSGCRNRSRRDAQFGLRAPRPT